MRNDNPRRQRRRRSDGRDGRRASYAVENFERRLMLFANEAADLDVLTTAHSTVTVAAGATLDLSGKSIEASGYTTAGVRDVGGSSPPTGTVTIAWYGGATLGTFTLVNPTGYGANNTPPAASYLPAGTVITLNPADAGTPLTTGPLAGDYILTEVYSGDPVYVATRTYTAADYAMQQTGDFGDPFTSYVPAEFIQFGSGHLSVTGQPSDAPAGEKVSPAVTVAEVDASGSTDTTSTASVTVALASNSTGTGTLSGTTTEPAVNGVATFPDLSVDKAGQYALTFTDGAGNTATSDPFQVSGDHLVFTADPVDGTVDGPLKPAVVVSLEDGQNRVDTTDSTSTVTLTPTSTTGGNGGQVTGNTATLVAGVASFAALKIPAAGEYTLQATDGSDGAAVSGSFKVVGPHLAVVATPPHASVGEVAPVFVVVRDADGKIDTDPRSTVVVLTATPVAGSAAAAFGSASALAVPFVRGTAVLRPVFQTAGQYTVTVTEQAAPGAAALPADDAATPDTSDPFKVAGLHTRILTAIRNLDVNETVRLVVGLFDSRNQRVTDPPGELQLSLQAVGKATGALTATPIAPWVGGEATLMESISKAGQYTLTATDVDPTALAAGGAASGAAAGAAAGGAAPEPAFGSVADTSDPFTVVGLHLTLDRQPANADLNQPASLVAVLRDAHNRPVTDRADTVSLTLNPVTGPADADLGGRDTAALAGGRATLAPSVNHAGTYTLTAAALGVSITGGVGSSASAGLVADDDVAGVTTRTFRVYGLHVAVLRQPTPTSPAAPIAVRFALEDRHNHVVTGVADTLDLTLTVVDGSAGQSLGGDATATFTNGVASPTPVIDSAGVFTLTATDVVAGTAGGDPLGGGLQLLPNPDVTAVTTRRFTVRA